MNGIGSSNSFFGALSGDNNSEGSQNTFVENLAGRRNTTGSFNTYVGYFSGMLISIGGNGSHNTALGSNTFINNGITNSTVIGANTQVVQSNSLILGNGVSVGIGNTAPRTLLHVTGGKIYVDANGQGVVLKSPSGSCFELTVSNVGVLTTVPITCP